MGLQGTLTLTTHTYTHMHTHVQWTGGSAGHFTLTVMLTHKHAPIYCTRWERRALCNNTNNTHLYTHVCRALYTYSNAKNTCLYTHAHTHVQRTGGSAGCFTCTVTLTHMLVHTSMHPSTAQGGNAGHFAITLTHLLGRSSQILKSKQCIPLICDIKEGHKASTQTKFH